MASRDLMPQVETRMNENEQRLRNELRPFMQQSDLLGYSAVVIDVCVFVSAVACACALEQLWLKAFFVILAGTMISTMFVLAHDASHGCLVRSRRLNMII